MTNTLHPLSPEACNFHIDQHRKESCPAMALAETFCPCGGLTSLLCTVCDAALLTRSTDPGALPCEHARRHLDALASGRDRILAALDLFDSLGVDPLDPPPMFTGPAYDHDDDGAPVRNTEAAERRTRDRGCACARGKLRIDYIPDDHVEVAIFTHGDPSCPLAPRTKVGRNEACPCQSGAKYKHCCRSAS